MPSFRAPVGGSNRLLSVEELAAYLGVPKKTVYGCWRQWGLRGYRVGRYLRFREPHLVINAVLAEAVRDKKLAESPCSGVQIPAVVTATDFIIPAHAQIEAVAAGLPSDWAATVWLMHGCGLRIGEVLAVNLRCRIKQGQTLRVKEQVNPTAQLRPLRPLVPVYGGPLLAGFSRHAHLSPAFRRSCQLARGA
jgi:excisionase family DNA binding protein